MRSTLFYIPAEIAGVPVFGIGWLLLAWLFLSGLFLAILIRRQGFSRDAASYIPFLAIVALVIVFGLPMLVEAESNGRTQGIPVRGFGVMLVLATIAGVGLAAYRARRMGLDPEVIYSLAFCMFVAGIIGARLFYVIQKWNEFQQPTMAATLQAVMNFTKGGLVVYGSVLAGVPAGVWFLRRRKLPILAVCDIIAPSMVVGLAIGRIGCFLNGCCFGGVCLESSLGLTFPPGSPPYAQHQEAGWQSGVWLENKNGSVTVSHVAPDSPAANAGVKAGDELRRINGAGFGSLDEARKLLADGRGVWELVTSDGRVSRWRTTQPPRRSVPVHATQLYSAIDAALLAAVLWFFYPFRRRDGEVFALLLTIHPLSRFLLEMVRDDELGWQGTPLTISQWLSIAILLVACVMWWFIERQPRGSALPLQSQMING